MNWIKGTREWIATGKGGFYAIVIYAETLALYITPNFLRFYWEAKPIHSLPLEDEFFPKTSLTLKKLMDMAEQHEKTVEVKTQK